MRWKGSDSPGGRDSQLIGGSGDQSHGEAGQHPQREEGRVEWQRQLSHERLWNQVWLSVVGEMRLCKMKSRLCR